MKTTLTLLFTIISFFCLQAQVGLNLGYKYNQAQDWQISNNSSTENALIGDGYSIGVDYWIPMKLYRIDFLPEVNFTQLESVEVYDLDAQFKQQWFSFFLNTNFYLFDLEGDCDCPTFSKTGNFFEKGFFVQASPGVSYFTQSVDFNETSFESETIAYSIGIGLGIDIGISDFFTITPMAGYRYHFPSNWDSLEAASAELPIDLSITGFESDVRQLYAGLRLGFRFRP